jgi:hypothetical protein
LRWSWVVGGPVAVDASHPLPARDHALFTRVA